jgi:hypothetical protein
MKKQTDIHMNTLWLCNVLDILKITQTTYIYIHANGFIFIWHTEYYKIRSKRII